MTQEKGLYGQRPSASADGVRRTEMAEVERLTGRERALLALRLGRWLARVTRREEKAP